MARKKRPSVKRAARSVGPFAASSSAKKKAISDKVKPLTPIEFKKLKELQERHNRLLSDRTSIVVRSPKKKKK